MINEKKLEKTFMKEHEDRMTAIFNSWPNHTPIKAQVNEFIPEVCGVDYDYLFNEDPVGMAECTLLVQEYLGLDAIHSNTDMYNFFASNLGAKIKTYKKHIPDIDRGDFFIKEPEDIEKIRYNGIDAGKIKYHIAYNKAFKEYVGTDFPPTLDSPWNLAANLYGLENLIMDAISEPDFMHDMMKKIVCDLMAPFCDEMVNACEGIPYIVGADAWASFPLVTYDMLMEFDKPYVEMLNQKMESSVPFCSGGYWGIRYLEGEEREKFLDYTIQVGGGILYGYDPDPQIIGLEQYRMWADEKNVPLLLSVMNILLEKDDIQAAIDYIKPYLLKGKNGKTCFQLNFSNIGPSIDPQKMKVIVDVARFYGRTDTTADSIYEIPGQVETFEDFLKRKLKDNPEEYRFEWMKRSSYSHLLK